MSLLPDHISAMQPEFRNYHARVLRALHQPDSLPTVARFSGVPSAVRASCAALKAESEALGRLNDKVFQAAYCNEYRRQSACADVAAATEDLIRNYVGLKQACLNRPLDQRLQILAKNLRTNLERLAMWFSAVLRTLENPASLFDGGRTGSIVHVLRFSYPDTPEELDNWVDTPSSYGASDSRDLEYSPSPPPAPRRQPRSGGWLTPFVLGWIVGDWLFDDDGDA